MPHSHSNQSSNDLDRLEAELDLALADVSLPTEKRRELERRIEQIRIKADLLQRQ